jgi:hypothetical protein
MRQSPSQHARPQELKCGLSVEQADISILAASTAQADSENTENAGRTQFDGTRLIGMENALPN